MNCDAVKSQLFVYADGEASPAVARAIDAHIAGCAACRGLLELEGAFRELYVERLRPDQAPPALRRRVERLFRDRLKVADAGRLHRGRRRLVVAAVMALTLGIALGMAFQSLVTRRDTVETLVDAALDQHQKLVRGVLPADISGVTPKGAEAWFQRRLSFNVSLPDLRNEGLTFLGGRISHLGSVEVAALGYRVEDQHVSLFILPETTYRRLGFRAEPKFKVLKRHGYDVIVWQSHGMGYALVSEIGGRSCLVCHAPEENVDVIPNPLAHQS